MVWGERPFVFNEMRGEFRKGFEVFQNGIQAIPIA